MSLTSCFLSFCPEHSMGEVLQYLLWAGRQQWNIHPALQNALPSDQVSPFITLMCFYIQHYVGMCTLLLFFHIPSFSLDATALHNRILAVVAPSTPKSVSTATSWSCTVAVQLFLFDCPPSSPSSLLTPLSISLCWTQPWGLNSAVQNLALCHWNKIVSVCETVKVVPAMLFYSSGRI